MSFVRLTKEQQATWSRLHTYLLNHHPHHTAVRLFALQLIEEQPDKNAIVLNPGQKSSQLLKSFDKKQTKQAYIAHHKKNMVWGEDAILYLLLFALGYKPFMNVNRMWFEPFVQPTDTGLTIKMINYGHAHFELHGHRTPADGNCMYRMVVQQIEHDFPALLKKSSKSEKTKRPSFWKKLLGGESDAEEKLQPKRYDLRSLY